MSPPLLVALVAGMLLLNFFLWKRRGRGWRRHVDALIAVLQPHVPERVLDVVVLQPAGTVGRQARAEQGRGLDVLLGGMAGTLQGAVAEHRAAEGADAEGLPELTALAVGEARRYLLPVALSGGAWSASPVARSWATGEAAYAVDVRALTVQVTITSGPWAGAYEVARDPAGYALGVLERLAARG